MWQGTIKLSWWNFIVGLLGALAGFALYKTERSREKERQRTWVIVAAFAIMIAASIYGLGIGEFFVFSSAANILSGSSS